MKFTKKRLKIFFITGLGFFMLALPLHLSWNESKPVLTQKLTLNRLLSSPLMTLGKAFEKSGCSVGNYARADFSTYTAANGYSSPGNCNCGAMSGNTSAKSWNQCLGCLFVMFVGLYNNVTTELSSTINPDSSNSGPFSLNNISFNFVSQVSALSGYDRHVYLSKTSNNALCVNIHYAKGGATTSGIKALVHMDTAACGMSTGGTNHSMVMKFDLAYTSATSQTGTFMHVGDETSDAFDLTASNSDDIFWMKVNIDTSTATPVTSAWVLRLNSNSTWRYMLKGEDDNLLYVAEQTGLALNSATVDSTGVTEQCINDASDSAYGAQTNCSNASYTFSDFDVSPNDLRTKTYPSWTTSTSITAAAAVQSYF